MCFESISKFRNFEIGILRAFAARFDFEIIDVFEIITPLYTHPGKREIRKFRRNFKILVFVWNNPYLIVGRTTSRRFHRDTHENPPVPMSQRLNHPPNLAERKTLEENNANRIIPTKSCQSNRTGRITPDRVHWPNHVRRISTSKSITITETYPRDILHRFDRSPPFESVTDRTFYHTNCNNLD